MKNVLLVVAVVLLVLYLTKSPGQPSVDYFTQDPTFSSDNEVTVTHDQMQKMIQLTQPEVSKQLGKCTQCIHTDTVQLVGNTYNVRFMFMVQTDFPYGVGVDAMIRADENKEPQQLLRINMQSDDTIDSVDKFDQFRQASDFSADVLPTIAQLQAVLNRQ